MTFEKRAKPARRPLFPRCRFEKAAYAGASLSRAAAVAGGLCAAISSEATG